MSFEDVKESAENGTGNGKKTLGKGMVIFINLILGIIFILLNPITIGIIIISIIVIKDANKKTIVEKPVNVEEPLNILQEDRQLPSDDKVEYYREIPCKKFRSYLYWRFSK